MKIIKISYTRKFNLGSYESEDITLEAEVNDEDSPQTVLSALADQALNWHLANQRKQASPAPVTAAPPTVKVQPPVKSPMQQANENSYPQKLSPAAQAIHDLGTLPTEIRERLTVNEGKIYIEYTKDKKPWIETMNALRPLGYEWISDGNNSHWRLKQA